jgi:nucleotide-binding universal stress UspA family protein
VSLPEPEQLAPRAVLLATEERPLGDAAIEYAARFGAPVYVFAVARVHGTSLGFPHPGLLPNREEWEAQRKSVARAVKQLRKRGIKAEGRVLGTRAAAKKIVQEAAALGCDAIVMGADPPAGWMRSDFMWSQEPYRVRRRAAIPVYLVTDAA